MREQSQQITLATTVVLSGFGWASLGAFRVYFDRFTIAFFGLSCKNLTKPGSSIVFGNVE
jgi:hypothetical protein